MLSSTRQRLIGVYNQLAGPLTEQQSFVNPTFQKRLQKTCQVSLEALKKDRKAIDKAIEQLIESDEQLKALFGLISSVPGIGPATATEPGRPLGLCYGNKPRFGSLPTVNQGGAI